MPNFSRPSRFILITALSGITYEFINQNTLLFSEPRNIIAIFTCAIVRFFLESFELSFSTHFIYKQSILTIWRKYFLTIFIQLLMMTPLGAILALLYQNESWAIILITAPTIALYYSLYSYQKTIDEVEKTFEALAHIIDEKDHYTSGHSERVAKFGKVIALELNLGDIRAQEIEKAGRIHDLGKINIPDKILQKKGALNPEETLLIQTHPSLILQLFYKYDRLKKYLPVKMASLHHERYDGLGYPYGLREKEIPLGARILAVADTFDALTSDRPYRKRLSEEEALQEIKKNQGTQFDPLIVEAILKAHQKGIVKSIMLKWHVKEKAYFKKQKSQEIFEKLKNSIEK
ncbi:MAG: HD-GYP domain-containing protein [Armatimonadetes bacterium]|nr:HD-GYP domain-containing protein [Armatimonadota bacterium]